jgi:hypothetical protein
MAAERTRLMAALLALVSAATAAAPLADAQAPASNCAPAGMSGQCNELGTIYMEFQRNIDGQPVDLTAHITIDRTYREQEVRAFLFSVRNASTERGPSPVTVSVTRFATPNGDVSVTKSETPGPNEVDVWVDILDLPEHQPIELTAHVGVRDKGAFNLEVLVMPFDRAYHTVTMSDGAEASLFASTMLAVNGPTADTSGGSGVFPNNSVGKRLPGFEAALLAPALLGALLLAMRRPPRGA